MKIIFATLIVSIYLINFINTDQPELTDEYAAHIKGGIENAKRFARSNGLDYIAPVSSYLFVHFGFGFLFF